MAAWIASHFLYATGLGLILVIGGAIAAFKAESKFGYIMIAVGVVLLIWCARLHGLI